MESTNTNTSGTSSPASGLPQHSDAAAPPAADAAHAANPAAGAASQEVAIPAVHLSNLTAQTAQDQPNQTPPSQTSQPTFPSPASASESIATAPSATITPHVVQTVQQAEMRVGIQPDGLGPIEIHAVLRGQELGASISAQQPDTRQWLTAHMTELTQNLAAHDLRVSSLSVGEPSANSSLTSDFSQSGSKDQSGQYQQKMFSPAYEETEADVPTEIDLSGELSQVRSGVDLRA